MAKSYFLNMKQLIDILEKLDLDKVSLIDDEFPIDGSLEDIIKFLIEHNFKEIKELPSLSCYTDYVIPFNNYGGKCFGITADGLNGCSIIFIANTLRKKISKSNMLYVIKDEQTRARYRVIWGDSNDKYVFLDENEFKKEIEGIL